MTQYTIGTYVIRKGALFYRPNAQGYTANIEEAGLFTLERAQAEHENRPDEVHYAPLADHMEELFLRSDQLKYQLAQADGLIKLMRARVAPPALCAFPCSAATAPAPVDAELNNSRDGDGI